jgi:hypothetical protein
MKWTEIKRRLLLPMNAFEEIISLLAWALCMFLIGWNIVRFIGLSFH